ncbi:MAG: toll/interleukin-1 receptor domain-containing protein [Solobacterium sp.]|nr:toll/interleukin-1 receptor domain-containing protein [Solobacterium sp.]
MAPNEEYFRYRNWFAECGRQLSELISEAQRIPFSGRKACEELQTILSQLIDQSRRYDYALKTYQKEYEAYFSGLVPDDSVLCRCEKDLEQVMRSTLMQTAEWKRRLSELPYSVSQFRNHRSLMAVLEQITRFESSLKQTLAAGITHPQMKPAEPDVLELSKVQFSAVAPKEFVSGQYMILNIVMYEDAFRSVVADIMNDYDEKTQEARSGVLKAAMGSGIRVVLTSPDYTVTEEETGIWNGEYLNLSFAVELPEDYKKNQVLYFAQVYINEIPSVRLKFIIRRSAGCVQLPSVEREDYMSAFVSYASEDRKRVAGIIQGMKKARPDLDIFFDVESIRSGANWKDILYEEIRKRDMLYLCWSRYARESRWVDEEWRYALKYHGSDHIDIVPLDTPDSCPPPAELRDKNFNEKLLYIINYKPTE